jgi:hypothetical protein
MMLDRVLLIGSPEVPGLFADVIRTMQEEAATRSV